MVYEWAACRREFITHYPLDGNKKTLSNDKLTALKF